MYAKPRTLFYLRDYENVLGDLRERAIRRTSGVCSTIKGNLEIQNQSL